MTLPISLLVVHFIADWLLQTDWMAIQKSKRWDALSVHVLVYASCFGLMWGWKFFLLTFISHFVTDAITSRITSRLWFINLAAFPEAKAILGEQEKPIYLATLVDWKRHWFFVVIGLDQLIHAFTLAATWSYLQ